VSCDGRIDQQETVDQRCRGKTSPCRWISNKENASETYLQAYERDQRPQSHLITVSDDWEEVSEPLASSESERENDEWVDRDWLDETDREDVFAIRNIDWTFAADRPERSIAARKREVLDGVYPPRLKNLAPGKENRVVNGDTGRPVRTGKGAVLRPNKGKDPVP